MKIKLNVNLKGYKKGSIIDIYEIEGIPKDQYWRNRLKDSKIDNCIEIIKEKVEEKIKIKPKKSGGKK